MPDIKYLSPLHIDMNNAQLTIDTNSNHSPQLIYNNVPESIINEYDMIGDLKSIKWDFAIENMNEKKSIYFEDYWTNTRDRNTFFKLIDSPLSQSNFVMNNAIITNTFSNLSQHISQTLANAFNNSFYESDIISFPVNKTLLPLTKSISYNFTYNIDFDKIIQSDKKINNIFHNIKYNNSDNIELNTELLELDNYINSQLEKASIMLDKYMQLICKYKIKSQKIQELKKQFSYKQYIDTYENFIQLFNTIKISEFFLNERKEYTDILCTYIIPLLQDETIQLEKKSEFIYYLINTLFEQQKKQNIINIFNDNFYKLFIHEVMKDCNLKKLDYIINDSFCGKIILGNTFLFNYFKNVYQSYILLNDLKVEN